jgi:hypothetical protein
MTSSLRLFAFSVLSLAVTADVGKNPVPDASGLDRAVKETLKNLVGEKR